MYFDRLFAKTDRKLSFYVIHIARKPMMKVVGQSVKLLSSQANKNHAACLVYNIITGNSH